MEFESKTMQSQASPAPAAEMGCVYTALFGDYEKLNEQPARHRSGLRFVCFTDDPELRSETWEIVPATPRFPMDPIRSQREYKILPHRFLPGVSVSLYIDNAIVLKEPPDAMLQQTLSDCDFALPGHSFRRTILDEFLEVVRLGFDDSSRVFEQLNHYESTAPEVLERAPYWCGMLFRRHGNAKLEEMLDLWLSHIYRYSRRDQLSFVYCCNATGLEPKRLWLDNYASSFHTWPVAETRDRFSGTRSSIGAMVPTYLQLRHEVQSHQETRAKLEKEIEAHLETRERLSRAISAHISTQSELDREVAFHRGTRESLRKTRNSLTWRATEPLRRTAVIMSSLCRAVRRFLPGQ